MYCKSYESAKLAAQENANYFDRDYVVFSDTAGVWRCERASDGPRNVEVERFTPQGKSTTV